MNTLSLINPSLEIVYCSTTLSNHNIIRLVRFVSKIRVGVVEWGFAINLNLILRISGKKIDVTGWWSKFWELNGPYSASN
jgi:hypothetical protein